MKNPGEIRKLAEQRLREAEVLFKNDMYDGAFYLAGYCVELTLKAKICERLGISNLFDDESDLSSIKGIGDIRKLVKTHNLLILFILSGLKVKFDEDKAQNSELAISNTLLFNVWDENVRYKPSGFSNNKDVKDVIKLLSSNKGLISWIEKN
jgi:hypothetical protein